MTTNQTIDDVPRELIEKAMLACFEAGFGIPHGELRALLDSAPCAKSQAEPDPALCKFYDVSDWSGLVRELVGHVALLQDSAKRNVKPWEDTFPPTLLPAYIERVNDENAAAKPQGEPVADALSTGFYVTETGGGKYAINIGFRSMAEMQAADQQLRDLLRSRHADQPAPVAVITYQQVFKAYEYAESHPHKYLRGTTNWCAAVAHSLNIK